MKGHDWDGRRFGSVFWLCLKLDFDSCPKQKILLTQVERKVPLWIHFVSLIIHPKTTLIYFYFKSILSWQLCSLVTLKWWFLSCLDFTRSEYLDPRASTDCRLSMYLSSMSYPPQWNLPCCQDEVLTHWGGRIWPAFGKYFQMFQYELVFHMSLNFVVMLKWNINHCFKVMAWCTPSIKPLP